MENFDEIVEREMNYIEKYIANETPEEQIRFLKARLRAEIESDLRSRSKCLVLVDKLADIKIKNASRIC